MSARLAVVFAALLLRGPARADTPCPTTDQLCTGDPCVTVATDIGAHCTLDFGARTLVIAGGLRIPDGGDVTIKAGTITVQAGINGRSVYGADLTLEASGNLVQEALVDVSGSAQAGSITMQVGGDATLTGKMRATGSTQVAGGSITILAGGRITGPGGFSHDIHAGFGAPAGRAIYRADGGINLVGHLITRSSSGGYIEFTSANGPVSIGTDIRTRTTGAGGTILVSAGTDATIARGMSSDGGTDGGTIVVSGATVTMPRHQGLHARGRRGAGGIVVVLGGVVVADEALVADGFTRGGTVDVSAEQLTVTVGVTANGGNAGGHVSLVTRSGDLVVGPIASASGGGGVVEAHSAGNLTAHGALRAGPGGCIGLSASGVVDVSAAATDTPITSDCP